MKKRVIIASLLLSVICLNGIGNLEVEAFENTAIINVEKQDQLRQDNFGVSTLSTTASAKTFYYEDENGNIKSYTISASGKTGLIFTPNDTDASDLTLSGNEYYTLTISGDHPDIVKEQIKEYYAIHYPNAIYLSAATWSYNCHSYAWYSQNASTNNVWLNLPNIYYHAADMSYKKVDSPQIGDIICYFDLDLPEEYQNIHSGIVVGFSGETSNNICGNSNTVIVQSKWGDKPLFEHKGDECPYVGDADEVRYYRPRTNASYTLSSSMNDLFISRTVNGGGSITDKYGMYELNVATAVPYTITIQSDEGLDNRLYDANMNLTSMTLSESSTGSYTYVANLSAGRYYLRTAYTDTTNSGTISITIKHAHTYDEWTYYTNSTHIESCCCGVHGTTTRQHIVKSSEIVDYRANCLECGYLLDLRTDMALSTSNNTLKLSVNGSYILPSGIIVLLDEDVEAYLNGTLVFYDKNDLPVTQ